MSADNIEKLYQNYGILADAKDDISKHEKEYLEILAAVKGSDKEKRLASQFIAKFFSSFPNLAEQAIEAQFDLCEDDDVAIRKQAIKDLPSLCKDNKEHTQRIADILAQLLQSDDATEINVVTNALLAILKSDPKGSLVGLFSQIHQSTDSEVTNEVVRERCIKFLATKVKQLGREVINKEAEDLIITECKKILEDVVAEEFEHIMELLTWSRLGKTPAGKKELVQLIAALALSPDDWHPEDPENVDRIIQCTQHALPLFSTLVDSTQFVSFFCEHVLTSWKEIASPDGGSDSKLELLKIFAEITEYCGEIQNVQDKINAVYDLLMNYLPEAPVESEPNSENKEKTDTTTEDSKSLPSLQFSHVECALFALHSLCRKAPDAITADAARLKDLRLRLQYTARLTQGYIKKLKEVTQSKKADDANSEENKLKIAALKTTSNINTLIRDIFRTPPSFKSRVQLSFQSNRKIDKEEKLADQKSEDKNQSSAGQKRHRPITFDNGDSKGSPEKRSRSGDRNLKMYTPPSGKYSSRLNNSGRFSGPNSGRGRGGGYGRRDFRNNGAPYRRRSNY
ncbi:apoptosis inhibitor 5 [Galleria mellonella]|uniref:Apoptosis inhibitor 5 n=1 Tax=Galleria mellonella TaxID=7137 RepID=A0A6J1X659_GALME|nr:apoptosis inhibitor 5 [Galleria mellonella]